MYLSQQKGERLWKRELLRSDCQDDISQDESDDSMNEDDEDRQNMSRFDNEAFKVLYALCCMLYDSILPML